MSGIGTLEMTSAGERDDRRDDHQPECVVGKCGVHLGGQKLVTQMIPLVRLWLAGRNGMCGALGGGLGASRSQLPQ